MRSYHPTTVKNVLDAITVEVRDGSVIRPISAKELLERNMELEAQSAKIVLDPRIVHHE